MKDNKERIQKILSDLGFTSRRKAEKLIEEGRVTLNGKKAKLGDKALKGQDIIKVDGKEIKKDNKNKYYIMLYKPRGFLSSVVDDRGRKCVTDLVKDIKARLYPVGRLDKDSEGLLLMTNDGEFANSVMHPKNHIEKRYRVTVKPRVTEDQLVKLSTCTEIDGKPVLPALVEVVKQTDDRSVLEIILKEGKNRQIRKMCEIANLEVSKLKRVAIGGVKLGMLQVGKYRHLTKSEINSFPVLNKREKEN